MNGIFSEAMLGNPSLKVRIFIGFLVLAMLGSLGTAYYFYTKATRPATEESAEEVVAAVGKLIELPEGEMPTVATVSNPDKVREQPFFANAKEGNKVLIYTKARKAILYDPAKNRIVEVAALTASAPAATTATSSPAH